MSSTPEYVSYQMAKDRCTNKTRSYYPRYGGRGIEFRFTSFAQFFTEIGLKPTPLHTLERINNDGHYEPGNVRWATRTEQAANKRARNFGPACGTSTGRHQRGYVFEANKAFHVRYYTIIDGVRKQKSKRLCSKDRTTGHGSPSAKAVRELCEEFMRTVNSDVHETCTQPLTVQAFWDTIYLPFIESNLKPSSVYGYKQIWNQHLKNHFGKTLMKDYKTPSMSMFLTSLAKHLRPRTIQHTKFLASAIFAHAVATGECETNPIRDAMVLGRMLENGITEAYSLEEIENVITALVDHVECQLIMALCFFLGLRKGEIQGLQWGDIDDKYCHIRRAFGRGALGTPKTRKSTRSVPLIAPVRVFLGLWRDRSVSALWVFPNEKGNAVSLDSIATRTIRPALERAGVPWKGYHAGRRGLGTALRVLTGNSNAGKGVLGHSDTRVTEEHYEGQMPEEALRGMKQLEERTVTFTKLLS